MSHTEKVIELLGRSHSVFHAVAQMKDLLLEKGFVELDEKKPFALEEGKGYFLTRNDSSIIAFFLPKKRELGFQIAATHNDSPSFKLKPNPIMKSPYGLRLNVEPYGGMLMGTWFDKPLSFAGRIYIDDGKEIRSELFDLEDASFVIPSIAIHQNRTANDGFKFNPAVDTIPLLGLNEEIKDLNDIIKPAKGKVVAHDLFLYACEKPALVGLDKEFLLSPRLDDLSSTYSSLLAFLDKPYEGGKIPVFASFDNEEVGSLTMQGAAGDFFRTTIARINEALGLNEDEKGMMIASSVMLSVDNAHGNHPNHPELADPTTSVKLNGGIVLKYNASAHYTTDGKSAAYVKGLCARLKDPIQEFTNRSDTRGGSTLGNISNAQVSMMMADIGIAQLAMHSSVELCGVKDIERMIRLLSEHYHNK